MAPRFGPEVTFDRRPHPATMRAMDTHSVPRDSSTPATFDTGRRQFLRGAVIAGGGLAAATLAACAPQTGGLPAWTYGPNPTSSTPAGTRSPATPAPTAGASMDHGSAAPSAAPENDPDARAMAVMKRFLDGEGASMEGQGNQPLAPTRVEGDTKVYELTVDPIKHRIDATKSALDALGFNGTWPGPRIDIIEGETIRAVFKNNMNESTGIHFHGQRLPNAMDGVPHITQDPIRPGESFAYEFTARSVGSHMYHSHYNAADQVGRGLLGAFIVHPRNEADRVERKYGVTQDILWISNDTLGGFTINGRGFPATTPIVASLGDRILVRFMNEGVMMHPWHLHGMPMRVVARDGYELGPAAFTCDTLGVNPGERWDVVID